MRRTALTLCFLLPSLCGCAAYRAHEARTALPGMTVPDLEACAGIPAKVQQIGPQEWLLAYSFKSTDPALSLKLLSDLDLEIGGAGGCDLTVRAREPGYVVAVHYAGSTLSTNGANAACGPLVTECVKSGDHSTLPAGYSLRSWLGKTR